MFALSSILFSALFLVTTVQAEEIVGFPRSDFGKVVLSKKQSFAVQLEGSIGQYSNEPISLYSDRSLFARLGRPVGRLDILTNVRVFPCTAFLVSDKYIVTNYHCVPGILDNPKVKQLGATRIEGVQLVLGYTHEGIEEYAKRFTVSPVPVEKSDELDYAILEVFGTPSKQFGTITLSGDEPYDNQPFIIIGHPLGSSQRISREQCLSAAPALSGGRVRHKCDTLPGNSGSPVFDQDRRAAIALHHAGSRRSSFNFAIPFSRIINQSKILSGLVGTRPNSSGTGVSQGPRQPLSEAVEAWRIAQDSASCAVVGAVINRFPNTFWADLAHERLKLLKCAVVAGSAPGTTPKTPPSSNCLGVTVRLATGKSDCINAGSGKSFRDCPRCPRMTVVPSGSFMMGSPDTEPGRQKDEAQVDVSFATPFAIGIYEVTFAEWDACVADGGCRHVPDDAGWGRGERPVINVSWDDVTEQYLPWLSRKTGKTYRLPSEAEWEYVARAGTKTPFWWGASIIPSQANYDGDYNFAGGGAKGESRKQTVPVDSFEPNPWGLHSVHGNVYEWTQDCWNVSNAGSKRNGEARTEGDCSRRALRGGSWYDKPGSLRSAYRQSFYPVFRFFHLGFRVVRITR